MDKKTKFLNICYSIATTILLLIFIVNLINLLCWLVKIPITKFHFPISFILTIGINYCIQKNNKLDNISQIISIFSVVLIFVISLLVANRFLDISYDGGWYHSISIIRLSEGWNPIYELIESGQFGDIYINSYACKSIWGFGATIYSLFGNLNSSKIISTLVAFALFTLSMSIFGKKTKNKFEMLMVILISVMIAFNPIYIEQMYTNYIDSTLGLYCMCYFLLFISLYLKQNDFYNLNFKLLIIILIALMTNTKLTGLYLAASFFGLFIIPKIIKDIMKKEFSFKWFKTMFFTGFIGVSAAFIIGINPFVTNIIRGHNMFYPILGIESIEVMGNNIPEFLRNRSNLEKIIIVNLAETTNNTNYTTTKLSNPFDIEEDIQSRITHDTRVGAFGPLFPTIIYILIISVSVFLKKILNSKENKLFKQVIFISCLYIILNAMIFSESWWGRYYPIIWLIPILISIYYILQNNKLIKTAGVILLFIAMLNCGIVYKHVNNNYKENSRPITDYIKQIKNGSTVLFWCNDPVKKWDYAYMKLFEENGIKSISADEPIEYADFRGYNIEIKILKNKEIK